MKSKLATIIVATMFLANASAFTCGAADTIQRMTSEHLPNPVRIHPKVISGGSPESDAAFEELAKMGVRTIISVDAMQPDVSRAARYGLRYVHLPHGYDGVPTERTRELAKAVRDLPGQIYIHCHHGKHRSPAAASVACVGAGLLPPESAIGVLEIAGTSPSYRGLFYSARTAKKLPRDELDALQVEFTSRAAIAPMAEAMVELEHTFANMQSIARAGWQSPVDHPDLDPAHEALLLREHFTELLRADEVKAATHAYRRLLEQSEDDARSLERLLDANTSPDQRAALVPVAQSRLDRIGQNCTACHAKFRDVPLSEK